MSFGYSVGDFIGGANLTYQLIRVLKDSCGASVEYQEAMLELGAMQQAFLQVNQMCNSPIIPQATVNSASHIVMSAMDIISEFLERSRTYQRKLGVANGQDTGSSWCKVGWALFKKEELRQLRDSLHSRLSSVSLLLSAASYCNPVPEKMAKFQVQPSKEEDIVISSMVQMNRPEKKTLSNAESPNRAPKDETAIATPAFAPNPPPIATPRSSTIASQESSSTLIPTVSQLQDSPPANFTQPAEVPLATGEPTTASSVSYNNHRLETPEIINHGDFRDTKETTNIISSKTLVNESMQSLPTLVDGYEMDDKWKGQSQQRLVASPMKMNTSFESQVVEEAKNLVLSGLEARRKLGGERTLPPIRFKDAVGRKFIFPYHLVKTWSGMEEVIKQAFLNINVLGPHVQEGHYDLIGPSGEVILPSTWDFVIQPDWAVNMTMWPLDKAPLGQSSMHMGRPGRPMPPLGMRPGGPPGMPIGGRPGMPVHGPPMPPRGPNIIHVAPSFSSDSSSDVEKRGPLSRMKGMFRKGGLFRGKTHDSRPSSSGSSEIID